MKKALEEAKLELILIDNDVIVTSGAGSGEDEVYGGDDPEL